MTSMYMYTQRIQSGFSCSNLINYDVIISSKFMLLCEEWFINSCGKQLQKNSWKEVFWKIAISKSVALFKIECAAANSEEATQSCS